MELEKASNRTRSHLNSPGSIQREFKTKDQMEESANKLVEKHVAELTAESVKDKQNGFDINDIMSIMNFETGYTPIGSTLIVKEIKEEHKIGDLLILDKSATMQKAVVITPGLQVTLLKKGDIVAFKAMKKEEAPLATNRVFNKVKFLEIDYIIVGGVFESLEVMQQRLAEDYKKYKSL